ncbi:MAG: hypothetical protein ACRDI2_10940, partial [Chloroflexota bacterium]
MRRHERVGERESTQGAPGAGNGVAGASVVGASPDVPDASGTAHLAAPLGGERQALAWGALPVLCLVGALGLLLVALATNGARTEATWAGALFWAGLLVLFVPAAARLVSPEATREERIGLVGMLGAGLYLVKVLHSPLYFTFYDELQHWRTADDLLRSGRLFEPNPLLRVSPFYPGLENVTSAMVSLSGLSNFQAGLVVLGVARLVLVLALYLFYEAIARSARVAGIATLLYMTNPNFLFFDAQYAYESLAIPLAILTLWAAARRIGTPDGVRVRLTLAVLLGVAVVAITHHLTAYALAAFLALWAAASLLARPRGADGLEVGGTALLAVVAAGAWLVYVGSGTLGYLVVILGGGLGEFVRLLAGDLGPRRLFRDMTGQVSPVWEQLTGYASVGLILLVLPFGLRRIWSVYRPHAVALALAGGALTYPLSLAVRLTERGLEVANRTSEFLFVAVAFVLAVAIGE